MFSSIPKAVENFKMPVGVNNQLATNISIQNVILLIVYLAVILLAAYLVTKYVARRALTQGMKKKTGSSIFKAHTNEPGTLLSVADRIAVDKTKTIMVIEFQEKYYLMTTTENDIKCIDKIPIPQNEQTEQKFNDGAASTAPYIYTKEQYNKTSFLNSFKRFFSIKILKNIEKTPNNNFNTQLKKETLHNNKNDNEK